VADVQIRVATHNQKGLQDALRGIVTAGGTIDHDWPLSRALDIGDAVTGTHVLTQQYRSWSTAPVQVDREKLWQQLGVRRSGEQVEFSASAPYAKIREAITTAKPTSAL
jgi:regulation of enolase protein 1 (concanavalin A-like superfamily)